MKAKGRSANVQYVSIDESHAGQRLDNYLLSKLKGSGRSLVYRIVRKGEVRVNKRRVKPSYRLALGDQIRIPPLQLAEKSETVSVPSRLMRTLEASILYEDDDFLVLNKPPGLAVHGGSGLSMGVIEALRAIRPHAAFLELIHRLDRDTSGLLMLAKSRPILLEMQSLLRGSGVKKSYLSVLVGQWKGRSRWVEASLSKTGRRGRERLMKVDEKNGDVARSHFKALRHFQEHTLVEVTIATGRTHQIRVHAASLGHPVVGDTKYGDFPANRCARAQGLKRQFLHASTVEFRLPTSGKRYVFEAPLSADLKNYLERMK